MNKRMLILILDCGENELKGSLGGLQKQIYKNWQKVIFSNLPNKKAHDTLYTYIMDHADEYDLFVKLDADTILRDEYALENIVKYFNDNSNVDQANFAVHDVMSDQDIMGLLVFTNKAKWNGSNEKLFVDYTPTIPGKRLLIWGKPAPIALHCSNPHLFQAFHYGAHRAIKAIQGENNSKKWIQSALQWHLLIRVWTNFKKKKDIQRGMIMLGAFCVWSQRVDLNANEYNNQSLKMAFNRYKDMKPDAIYQILIKKWRRVLYKNHLLYLLLWPKIIEYKIRCRITVWYNQFQLRN
jgi:hypothetical protein